MKDDNFFKWKRLSASIINAPPIYLKQQRNVIFAADKSIHIFDCAKQSDIYILTGHSDTVTYLKICKNELISGGLDGNIITWDLTSGRMLQKQSLRAPITNICQSLKASKIILHEKNSRKWITSYSNDFEESTDLLEKFDSPDVYLTANDLLIAAVSGTDLLIYWPEVGKKIRYKFPLQGSTDKSKKFTCIACHPTEAILATGNEIGEIMIWWNFTTSNLSFRQSVESKTLEDEENADSDESSDFSEANKCIDQFKMRGETFEWRFVNPSKVKRSIMHWHSTRVTTILFTAEGKHLYSGGLEGVLVKWDLTECFGGARNRRFFSLLGSPICGIGAPGGESEETVVVTLEKNAFLVLDGALKVVFREEGLGQIPSRWRHSLAALSKSPIGILSVSLLSSSEKEHKPALLLNSSMGELQLLNCQTGNVIDKLNVNRKPYAMCDRLTEPLFSEVLLAAVSTNPHSEWLVTYEELQLPKYTNPMVFGGSIDNQARLTWWQNLPPAEKTGISSQFVPVFSECLAYLNCAATDLCLTHFASDTVTILLLKDLRLLIWQCNKKSDPQNSHKPWLFASCVALDSGLLYTPMNTRLFPVHLLHVNSLSVKRKSADNFPFAVDSDAKLGQSADAQRDFLLYASGTKIYTCIWSRWKPTATAILSIDEVSPLTHVDLSESFEWKEAHSKMSSPKMAENNATPMVTNLLRIMDKTRTIFVASLLAEHGLRFSKISSMGGICLLELVSSKQNTFHLKIKNSDYTINPIAISCHTSRSIFAVGQLDGSCKIYEISDCDFNVIHNFANVPSFPFCDRQQFKRRNRNKRSRLDRSDSRDASYSLVASQPNAICFVDSSAGVDENDTSSIHLAAVFTTMLGRELGRKDLVVFDSLNKAAKSDCHDLKASDMKENSLNQRATEGILQLTSRIEDVTSSESTGVVPTGYKSDVTRDLESVLRKVSHYPAHSAPPPEQLLAQLFKKPNL